MEKPETDGAGAVGGAPAASRDWSAAQYLKFGDQRTRPVHDLVSRLPVDGGSAPRIVDLGCGPGNSTAVLASRFPRARVSGVDSSPDMLARARATLPGVDFSEGDLLTWTPPSEGDLRSPRVDVFFSNAVLHWLRHRGRIPTILRLLGLLPRGGVFAFQVPDNHSEPSHRAMREVAGIPGRPWSAAFAPLMGSGAGDDDRPDLDPVEPAADFYNALIPLCEGVEVWHTLYNHVLPGPADIVEWVKGTGLQPFLNVLPEGSVREAYVQAYQRRLAEVYPPLADGKVMLRYPRLFVVAVKK